MRDFLYDCLTFILSGLFLHTILIDNSSDPSSLSIYNPQTTKSLMSDAKQDLVSWFQTAYGSLYDVADGVGKTDSQTLFDSVFSTDVQIHINHVQTTRQQMEQDIAAIRTASVAATIDWKDLLEIPESGIVAGFFVLTRSLKFRIRVGPAQTLTYSSFSAKIEQGPQGQRISELFLTTVSKAAPINLAPSHATAT